ncbi:DUF1127 domain-containing protein [Neptunicoccus sediminis]|uniref:DUF1127 domain-containing protein n=1 Tax=Neptunicoccus sediminis TaxID=1892596 RepID=UPI000846258B|nr:DUF1127 domain-containing protein [Neptunicoccus sediminis]
MAYTVTPLPRAATRRTGLLRRIKNALRLRRQRLHLLRLTDAQLRDIGLTRTQVEAEARRSPWDAPSHWKG